MLDDVFKKFNLHINHTRVYLALLEGGPSSAGHLAKRTDIRRSTLYGLLYDILQKGLVTQGNLEGVKKWYAEEPEKIQNILKDKMNSLQETNLFFNTLLPKLKSKQRTDVSDPHFQFFEGREGVKHILNAPLLYRDIETEVFWPITEMLDVIGEKQHIKENRERIRRNISIRAIWPGDKSMRELEDIIKKNPFLGVGKEFKREIRKAPKEINFQMGYWAFKDKIGFVSSKNEGFGFIVQSADFKNLLKKQFDVIWKLSTPIKVGKKYTQKFLDTV